MFAKRIYSESSAEYINKIIITDYDNIISKYDYSREFAQNGFEVIKYYDDLMFRVGYSDAITDGNKKYLVVVNDKVYLPYDILKVFRIYNLSYSLIFPNLNDSVVFTLEPTELDMLSLAYRNCFSSHRDQQDTKNYIRDVVKSRDNVSEYLKYKVEQLDCFAAYATNYVDWRVLAQLKAGVDVIAAEYEIDIDTDHINQDFVQFILSKFNTLSSVMEKDSPVTVSRAMEYMHECSDKFAIIVMDGMSEFDWLILSRSFTSINYHKESIYAMIPTTTSVSRQCLLSNKFPKQLYNPWQQNKEKQEFVECAKTLGYTDCEIGYGRGYDVVFESGVRCAAIIINDVDDMLHGQKQGRTGMFNDISLLSRSGKLVQLVRKMLEAHFDVYISADHGNTPCVGMGKLMKTGVETETKSRRMIVLKEYADKQGLIDKYNLIDYPKYYLDKSFDYLICNVGTSFDSLGEKVISHGGISLDEVMVPFIKIKAVENNG